MVFQKKTKAYVATKLIVAAVVVAVAYMYLFPALRSFFETKHYTMGYLAFTIGLAVYSVISFIIVPKPDYDDIGIAGGLIDNPFSLSDDINRFLIFLKILFLPGRIIAFAVVDLLWFFKGEE